jgi:competence ComEA-like helix-hairpin-helix protein
MKIIKDYFDYSRSERNGVFALLILSFVLFIAPNFYDYFIRQPATDFSDFEEAAAALELMMHPPVDSAGRQSEPFPFDPNIASYEEFLRLGLPEKTAATIINYRKKVGSFRKKEDLRRVYGLSEKDFERLEEFILLPGEEKGVSPSFAGPAFVSVTERSLFQFDPNKATQEEFVRLGIPESVAQRIARYREKGGRFKVPEDLKKIYGFPQEYFDKLLPYMTLEDIEHAVPASENPTSSNVQFRVDINRATAEEWRQLPGIGAYRAERIIGFRENLGGFAHIDQVAETYNLPDSLFRQIRPHLVESPVFRSIDINRADEESLRSHPYISWKQARIIISYREQHGPYTGPEDLEKTRAFDPASLERLLPYLLFGDLGIK